MDINFAYPTLYTLSSHSILFLRSRTGSEKDTTIEDFFRDFWSTVDEEEKKRKKLEQELLILEEGKKKQKLEQELLTLKKKRAA